VNLAKNLGAFVIELQWVQGDANKAEKSFFTINQQATAIDKTELRMIEERRKPNALAARAIIHAGTGHKYWSAFTQDIQLQIQQLAKEVYGMLYTPPFETPIKSLDVPVAGHGYSAESVKLVFDFVDFANRSKRPQGPIKSSFGRTYRPILPANDDVSGAETIEYLKTVRKHLSRITGTYPGSLGLHPLVYYFTATGRFQPTAFLATVSFVEELEAANRFNEFTCHRAKFEDFIVKHRYLINQIIQMRGSEERGLVPLVEMYRGVLAGVANGLDDSSIITELRKNDRLRYLHEPSEEDKRARRNFSSETKSTAYLREAMEKAVRCSICGARLHKNSITFDHVQRKEDGGTGEVDNAMPAHPYCNSGYKESQHAASLKVANPA